MGIRYLQFALAAGFWIKPACFCAVRRSSSDSIVERSIFRSVSSMLAIGESRRNALFCALAATAMSNAAAPVIINPVILLCMPLNLTVLIVGTEYRSAGQYDMDICSEVAYRAWRANSAPAARERNLASATS